MIPGRAVTEQYRPRCTQCSNSADVVREHWALCGFCYERAVSRQRMTADRLVFEGGIYRAPTEAERKAQDRARPDTPNVTANQSAAVQSVRRNASNNGRDRRHGE